MDVSVLPPLGSYLDHQLEDEMSCLYRPCYGAFDPGDQDSNFDLAVTWNPQLSLGSTLIPRQPISLQETPIDAMRSPLMEENNYSPIEEDTEEEKYQMFAVSPFPALGTDPQHQTEKSQREARDLLLPTQHVAPENEESEEQTNYAVSDDFDLEGASGEYFKPPVVPSSQESRQLSPSISSLVSPHEIGVAEADRLWVDGSISDKKKPLDTPLVANSRHIVHSKHIAAITSRKSQTDFFRGSSNGKENNNNNSSSSSSSSSSSNNSISTPDVRDGRAHETQKSKSTGANRYMSAFDAEDDESEDHKDGHIVFSDDDDDDDGDDEKEERQDATTLSGPTKNDGDHPADHSFGNQKIHADDLKVIQQEMKNKLLRSDIRIIESFRNNSSAPKDWNAEFQKWESMHIGSQERYRFIAQLVQDFSQAATAYAKIIISELCCSNATKTIKPASQIGGLAGGAKYIVQGILFKIAMDVQVVPGMWMYGGSAPNDDFAMKAATKEIACLTGCWMQHVQGISFPIMCIIDFKGFRIVALSLLPINSTTICYGSSDGGKTVHRKSPDSNEKIEAVMKGLFLKPHRVGINRFAQKIIYGPGDIEAHKGKDDRLYLIDFGRLFPPEAPSRDAARRKKDPRSVFYKFFRLEFLLRSYQKELCSDAFTAWDASDPKEAEINRQEVYAATDYLHNMLIPQQATEFEASLKKILSTNNGKSIVFFNNQEELKAVDLKTRRKTICSILDLLSIPLHGSGVNLRHLGRLRQQVTDPIAKKIILSVCCARTIKHNVAKLWRETMLEEQVPSEVPFIRSAIQFINTLLCAGGGILSNTCLQERKKVYEKQADYFWRQDLKEPLDLGFNFILTEDEMSTNFDLRNGIDFTVLLQELFSELHLVLKKSTLRHLYSLSHEMIAKGHFMLVIGDIKEMKERVRNLPIASYCRAMAGLIEAHNLSPFIYADDEYQKGNIPSYEEIRSKEASLRKEGNHLLQEHERDRLLKGATDYFYLTSKVIPMCYFVNTEWAFASVARAELTIASNEDKHILFEEALLRASKAPKRTNWVFFAEAYVKKRYAEFLQHSPGFTDKAKKLLEEAEILEEEGKKAESFSCAAFAKFAPSEANNECRKYLDLYSLPSEKGDTSNCEPKKETLE